ncbi:TrmH family RNA methyltransferase [Maribacter cobaltidurans]|uniref:RNA methyltransferase n=1 Tax=Maribacter cobaltidurans TaxID=1178778 RepID=A0A223V875_9FLAO|nr:RNA methyltransferase [Maribacter cobaltidurans]ASV31188.1 RNA methyltransferase [Maribacter cobaltidurans]GGD84346.1 RNA methyltransferase [Maribacter cobaltidurans]
MVVKSELKLIKNLQQKKYRNEKGLFVMEGAKAVGELLESGFKAYKLFSTGEELSGSKISQVENISMKELKQLSSLKNPNGVLGVFYKRPSARVDIDGWIVALDGVQDPGNLGTIIRLCDWFGIKTLICSNDTVDCYNSKVLQATMGSIARVNIQYLDLTEFLKASKGPVFGTFMDGENIHTSKLPNKGVLVMGNEGNGISEIIGNLCDYKVGIPQFGEKSTESLNVATATAIFLNEIKRRS